MSITFTRDQTWKIETSVRSTITTMRWRNNSGLRSKAASNPRTRGAATLPYEVLTFAMFTLLILSACCVLPSGSFSFNTWGFLQFFHRPKLGASCTGILHDFRFRGRYRLSGQDPDLRNSAADAAGEIPGTDATLGEAAEGILHDPILQRMK